MTTFHPDATRVIPAFPPPFVSAATPSAQVLYNRIPAIVHWNLDRICNEGVRYEENVYGYFNSAFTSIFPVSQQYQVNPQYPLRPHAVVGHGRTSSIGSTGDNHAARETGRESGVGYPDFVISKVHPRRPPAPRVNAPCLLVEIKTSDTAESDLNREGRLLATVNDALEQIVAYNERLRTAAFSMNDPISGEIPSYIVYGKYYAKVTAFGPDDYFIDDWQFVSEEMALPDRAPERTTKTRQAWFRTLK
ncbi:hypothetical protein H0H92_004759 [Tricholoma furcatifolium]|nr:hypothetical protein H0H92_004759 [Tricholoma furcatifolium]